MIKNFISIAFRNLSRIKSFSGINILGLSIGISAALVIFLIAFYEFSFDKFVPDVDRVYRVVMYTINTRIKAIGIRKILGSPITNIVSILSIDLIRLILIAFVTAAPLSWWVMHKWLDDFAFRSHVCWWIFSVSGVSMVLIAILKLSIHTLKAALANPVKSLRTE